MLSAIARIMDMHICPMQTPAVVPIPHVGGPVVGPGAPTVLAGGIPVAVMGDTAVCVGPPDVLISGSPTVLAGGKPVIRITDTTAHGGLVIVGLPTVLVGDSGGGSGGAARGAMSQAKAGGSSFVRTDVTQRAREDAIQKSAAPPPDNGTAWVEVEVVAKDGSIVPYQRVKVIDSRGTVREAFTDQQGVARVDGMAPGSCQVTLAELDESSWKPA